jgi:hypothetical protein
MGDDSGSWDSNIQINLDVIERNTAALDKVTAGLDKLDASGKRVQGSLTQTNTVTGNLNTEMSNLALGVLGPVASYATLAGVVMGFIALEKQAINAAAEHQTAMVQLDGTLRSMGRPETAAGLERTASAMMGMSTFDDEAILRAYTAIAKFDTINGAGMDKLVRTAMDVTAVMGGDLAGNAEMIARILETGTIPRSLAFNSALKEQVKEMIAAGNSGGALTLVLDELNKRYGGQAAAELNTYAGQVKKLHNDWQELLETAGGSQLGPGQGFTAWLDKVVVTATQLVFILQQPSSVATDQVGRYTHALEDARAAMTKLEQSRAQWTSGDMYAYQQLQEEAAGYTQELEKLGASGFVAFHQTEQAAQEYIAVDVPGAMKDWGDAFKFVTGLAGNLTGSWKDGMTAAQATVDELVKQLTNDADGFTAADASYVEAYGIRTGVYVAETLRRAEAVRYQADLLAAMHDRTIYITTIFQSNSQMGAGYNPTVPLGDSSAPEPTGSALHQAWLNYWNGHGSRPTAPDPGYASGGSVGAGGWAMVGDAPGGRTTPYTEYVHARPGGGFDVYNQSQMRGAVPMAGGGSMAPNNNDLMDRVMQKLDQLPDKFVAALARMQ